MSALLALGLAASASTATPPPYPAVVVLDAFKGLCASPTNLDETRTAAHDNGWEEFTPQPSSNLGKILANGKSMADNLKAKSNKAQLSEFLVFRRTVAGREIDAEVDTATITDIGRSISVTGCEVFDFDAPAMPPESRVTNWVGRTADQKVEDTGQATIWTWNVGLTGAGSKLLLAFVPSTSPMANPTQMMLLGFVMKAEHYTVTPSAAAPATTQNRS